MASVAISLTVSGLSISLAVEFAAALQHARKAHVVVQGGNQPVAGITCKSDLGKGRRYITIVTYSTIQAVHRAHCRMGTEVRTVSMLLSWHVDFEDRCEHRHRRR